MSDDSASVVTMTYRWAPSPVATPGSDPDPEFDDQRAAEAWLAEHWEELLDSGVVSVSLVEGDRTVYGPMPLTP